MLPDSFDLTGPQRWLFAGYALVALIMGVNAIYLSEDGPATAVLIVVGAVLLVLAIVGRMPYEIGFGDAFLKLGRDIPELPPDQRQAAMTLAFELAESLPANARAKALRAVTSGLEYQRRLIDTLHRVLPNDSRVQAETRAGDAYLDGVISRGRRSLAVEAKFTAGRALSVTAFAQAAAAAAQAGFPVLLVSDGAPTLSAMASSALGVTYVQWRDANDDGPLRLAVEAALSRDTSG